MTLPQTLRQGTTARIGKEGELPKVFLPELPLSTSKVASNCYHPAQEESLMDTKKGGRERKIGNDCNSC